MYTFVGDNPGWQNLVKSNSNKWQLMIQSNLVDNAERPVLVVFYEDLKQDLEFQIRRMLEFLDLPLSKEKLNATLQVHVRIVNITSTKSANCYLVCQWYNYRAGFVTVRVVNRALLVVHYCKHLLGLFPCFSHSSIALYLHLLFLPKTHACILCLTVCRRALQLSTATTKTTSITIRQNRKCLLTVLFPEQQWQ